MKAVNISTGKVREVPAHYINNPAIHGGVFRLVDQAPATPTGEAPVVETTSKASRPKGAGSVETPAVADAADVNDSSPAQAGEPAQTQE